MDRQFFLDHYLTNRYGTDCMKWDGLKDKFGEAELIGMWIADTEFRVCDEVRDAMLKRVEHGIFGYTTVPEEYYDTLSDWMARRYNCPVPKEWVRFTTGCVTGLAYGINCFTDPGDSVMILTPVYYPFFNVVTNNHRRLVEVKLTYEGGNWSMDYEAIEEAMSNQQVKLLLLCSPHNPCGRVWSEEELDRLFALCRKYQVIIVSDEIHQDLVIAEDKRFIPALKVGDGKYADLIMTVNSASKTFNLATLLHGHIIIQDESLRAKYDAYASGINRTEVSVMGMVATQAAYQHGEEWLEQVRAIIRDNYHYMKDTFAREAPDIVVCCLDATYLCMVDLRAYADKENMAGFVQDKCRLGVDYGEWFGSDYKGFIRINLATDPAIVKKAVDNILNAIH